ncbi:NAD(P)H-binding protein [Mycobacterium sp. Y57]|uniref:NAD(P)-dependent oxidoreductase n=1 Tax=Mycolicibacterium xanthum TaxID=2796469 RepID=UPI001C84EDA5|nr:NAD(P)H-binding protein [Mycolicibacterium xanthum]MBX7430706.1 NAD(P)H-binding protein [Mycolicibacterium xanthum]
MRVAVFGANGPTGRLLVRLLADRGHEVLASTRHPGDFPLDTEADTARRVSVVEVDVFQRQSIITAVDRADAVLSVLGVPFTRRPVDTFSAGAANIVAAMRDAGVRRLAVVSSTGAHHYRNRRNASLSLRIAEPIISRTIGRTVYADMRRMEEVVTDSGLDWTIVRPSTLFDADRVSDYVAGEVPPVGAFTARIDLAHYLSTLIDDTAGIGTIPIVSTVQGAPSFWQNVKREAFQAR